MDVSSIEFISGFLIGAVVVAAAFLIFYMIEDDY